MPLSAALRPRQLARSRTMSNKPWQVLVRRATASQGCTGPMRAESLWASAPVCSPLNEFDQPDKAIGGALGKLRSSQSPCSGWGPLSPFDLCTRWTRLVCRTPFAHSHLWVSTCSTLFLKYLFPKSPFPTPFPLHWS